MARPANGIAGIFGIFSAIGGIFNAFAGIAKIFDGLSRIFKVFSILVAPVVFVHRFFSYFSSTNDGSAGRQKLPIMDEAKVLFAELKEILKEGENPPRLPKHAPVGDAQWRPSGPLSPLMLLPMEDLMAHDEVWPGIYIGKGTSAKNLWELERLGITHVLNAAHGQKFAQIDVDPQMYADKCITFLGLPAMDVMNYKIDKHFDEANEFIKTALEEEGIVYVHCHQGRSRSAVLVLAYLMISCNLSVQEALRKVREKRKVHPNEGFLRQLCQLQLQLRESAANKDL